MLFIRAKAHNIKVFKTIALWFRGLFPRKDNMSEETTKPEEPVKDEKTEEAKPVTGKARVAKAKTVKVKLLDGSEFEGLAISERTTNSGKQVFVKLKGSVSRWFNAKDIVK